MRPSQSPIISSSSSSAVESNAGASTNSPTSSSRSSSLYNLDASSTEPILVYKHLSGNTVISTQQRLCAELDGQAPPTSMPKTSPAATNSPSVSFHSDPAAGTLYRCARKHIPRGASRIDVHARDALPERERAVADKAALPTAELALASIGLPRSVYWRRLLFGQFSELYILSPETSPAGSEVGSSHGDDM